MRRSVPAYNRLQTAGGVIDPLVVQGAAQITSTTTLDGMKAAVDRAKLRGEWSVVTIHRSVITAPGSLELTNANLDAFVAYLADAVRTGAIDCLPFGEAAELLGF